MTENQFMLDTATKWDIWCTDKFGRSNDTYVAKKGVGIFAGLRHLWSKELDGGYSNQGSRTWMFYDLVIEHDELKRRIKTFENREVLKKRY